MTPWLIGALLGACAGGGLLLTLRRLPFLRRPDVLARVGPYVRDVAAPFRFSSTPPTRGPLDTGLRVLRPSLRAGAARLERILGGSASIRRRLSRAGLDRTVEEFRIEQVLWGFGAFGIALIVSLVILPLVGAGRVVPLAIFCLIVGVLGVLARDSYLTSQVRRREHRLLLELPTVAELLALAVAAGEGPGEALARVARSARGALSDELRRVLAETRAGDTLVRSLDRLADRTGLVPLARFADGIAVALERGTPLADVLRAQAGDLREANRRELIEAGSKKEVAMMIPVVFLVMPVTIIFLFYPGAVGIRLIAG